MTAQHEHHEHGGLDDLHAELDTTPVFEAAREGRVDELTRILDADPSQLEARDKYRLTPLHWACDRGQYDVALLLVARGADVNAAEKRLFKRTPLLFAALSGNESLVQLLTEHKADVHATDYKGWTALHCAAHTGSISILRMLLGAGVVIATLTSRHESVLHLAARAGHEELVRWLVTSASDHQVVLLGLQDADGATAVEIARASGHDAIAALLSQA
uniref:Uncharacterized protein n=1 Tax=Globisporangium ultimum (strain ATCC 200006 / CBS 805.95 / DAOM BR144) TaxID=431595 RepID=K3W4Z1_GLOUD